MKQHPARQHVIEVLRQMPEGRMAPDDGKFISAEAQKLVLGATAGLLLRMQHDGLIDRETEGKRTKAIILKEPSAVVTVGDAPKKLGRPPGSKNGTGKKRISRKAVRSGNAEKNGTGRPRRSQFPLPEIGRQLTVWGTMLNRDGTVAIMLRDEARAWTVTVDAFSEEALQPA